MTLEKYFYFHCMHFSCLFIFRKHDDEKNQTKGWLSLILLIIIQTAEQLQSFIKQTTLVSVRTFGILQKSSSYQ